MVLYIVEKRKTISLPAAKREKGWMVKKRGTRKSQKQHRNWI